MNKKHAKQRVAIVNAAKRLNLDSHVTEFEYKKDLHTWADRIAGRFFRNGMPVKKSYMMCETLDMDFFFSQSGEAMYSYSGYADSRDANEKIINAFETANKMLKFMQEEIEREEADVS